MTSAIAVAEATLMEALAHPIGIGCIVTDPQRAKTSLYAARSKLMAAGMSKAELLTIRTSPDNPACELWIINQPEPEPPPIG